jgi:hypothetical protein
VPTPNVCADIWDPVESYAIHMFNACRLKITFTLYLKLIISVLVLHIVYSFNSSCCHLLPQRGALLLTLRVYLRLAIRPSAQLANLLYKNDLQETGTGTAFLQVKEVH